ncbi:MAG TPA: 1-phosphofructokinase family hexose kinase [Puia sp.]|nr:1-phosphofructokinase family hexose kinase [Puia sp.]
MPAIVTVTFHPCIDVNIEVPALLPDVKMLCSSVLRQPGGGGINVARAIHELGGKATAVYPAGGCTGTELSKLLAAEGVSTVILKIPGETRENIIVRDTATGLQYRCNLPGPSVPELVLSELLELLGKWEAVKYLVVSGSLPPGMDAGVFQILADLARRKGIRLIVDTSGEPLKAAIAAGAYLVKPSLHELLSLTTGRPDGSDVESRIDSLLSGGRTKAAVVSLGPKGALLATGNCRQRFPAPKVTPVSTIGAGDSLVAGIVLALHRGMSLEQAVAYGCLCGSAATLHAGTGLCRLEDVNRLKKTTERHEKDPVD